MVAYPLVNGVRQSWASVSAEANGLTYGGFTAINYAPTLDGVPVRGAGPLVIAHTTGLASWTADFEMLEEEWNAFQLSLGPAFMTTFFNFRISKSNEGYTLSGITPVVDNLYGCRIKTVGATMQASSADPLVRKAELLVTSGDLNGINPFPNMPSLSLGGVAGAVINGARRIAGI